MVATAGCTSSPWARGMAWAAPVTRSTRRRASRPTARRSSTPAPDARPGRSAAVTSDGAADGLLSPADVRALAAALGLRPTKALGQNFLVDPNTVRRIVRTADLATDDVV